MTSHRPVAVITGAASGIGQACADLLGRRGMELALLDRVPPADSEQDGGRAWFEVDVADAGGVAHAIADVVARYGRIDTVVTAAGIQRYGTVAETSEATWDDVFAVNVKGVFLTLRETMPHLRATRGSAVIVSSVQALATQTNVVAYTASKGALNAMARAIAVDEAPLGVRVNVVCPGSVDTAMLRASAALVAGPGGDVDAVVRRWGSTHPMGRVATPDEVARVIAFLAGDDAAFVTGEEIRVDGGLVAALGVPLGERS
ncbi:SDR family oxidoreductase [Jatrophihabitans sp.]|uniref:SDR family NAD(P)-dependent oxidoreductase n=1 Tax=Jatrophihabitans sp. TaxID=1932789 RepID=UPI0030C6F0D4|nr:family oxidoreductase [Jatrophihabitans sp.]